jgi:hypothetical protein
MSRLIPGPFRPYTLGSGATATQIQAALDAASSAGGGSVYLGPGSYTISAGLTLPSLVDLVGAGRHRTRLVPSFTGSVDDRTNAVILASGTLDAATVSTTLSADARRGSASITVTSATGIAASAYLELQGANGSSFEGDSDGSSIISTSVVQVSAAYAGGTTVTLAGPLGKSHKSGSTVKAVTPKRKASIRGLTLDASGGQVANGITARWARDLTVEDVGVKGFSRCGIEFALGTYGGRAFDCWSEGELNGFIWFDSADSCMAKNYGCDAGATRYHALGTTRALLMAMNDADSPKFVDGDLKSGCIAYWDRKTQHAVFRNTTISGMLIDEAYSRLVTASEYDSNARIGFVMASSAAQVAWSCNSWHSTWDNITVAEVDYDGALDNTVSAFYEHDLRLSRIVNCGAINSGGPTNTGRVFGLHSRDTTGEIRNHKIRGYKRGYHLTGTFSMGLYDCSVSADTGTAGDAANGEYPLYMELVQPAEIVGFSQSNCTLDMTFTGGTVPGTAPGVAANQRIRNWYTKDGYYFAETIVAINASGTNPNAACNSGEVFALDTAGTEIYTNMAYAQFITATAATQSLVVIVNAHDIPGIFHQNIPFMVAPLFGDQPSASVYVRAADTVRPGDRLVLDTTAVSGSTGLYLKKDNAATANYVVAIGRKTGTGAAARVQVRTP